MDRLYEEAEAATEQYNGAKEQADEAAARADRPARRDRPQDRPAQHRPPRARLPGRLASTAAAPWAPPSSSRWRPTRRSTWPRPRSSTRTGDRNAAEITTVRRQLDEVGSSATGRRAARRPRAPGRPNSLEHKRRRRGSSSTRQEPAGPAHRRGAGRLRGRRSAPAARRRAGVPPAAPPGAAARPAPVRRFARGPRRGLRVQRDRQAVRLGRDGPGLLRLLRPDPAAWRGGGRPLPRTT